MKNNIKILIIGSSGFMGKELIKKLIYIEGVEIHGTYFRNKPKSISKSDNLFFHQVDFSKELSISKLLGLSFDFVINLMTIINEKKEHTFKKVLFESSQNILKIAARSKVKHLIHLSALASSDSKKDINKPYLYYKEMGAMLFYNSTIRSTIIEVSFIVGPNDQHISSMAWTIKFLPFYPLANKSFLDLLYQPVHQSDLVDYIKSILFEIPNEQQIVQVASKRIFSYKDLILELSQILKKKRPIVNINYRIMKYLLKIHHYFFGYTPIPITFNDYSNVNSIIDYDDKKRKAQLFQSDVFKGMEHLKRIRFGDVF